MVSDVHSESKGSRFESGNYLHRWTLRNNRPASVSAYVKWLGVAEKS